MRSSFGINSIAALLGLVFCAVILQRPAQCPGADAPAAGGHGKDDQGHRVERIVFLGDSITDGDSYPLLIHEALSDAGRPVPVCINAGIGGDTASGMLKRLARDVLSHRPTRVTLSAGINDALHKVPDADYERDVTAIAEHLKTAKVPLVILSTSILGEKHGEADERLGRYNAILRAVAQKYDCHLADVNHLMHDARASGKQVLEEDQVHPNFLGHRLMARAVLDALGEGDVTVPETLKVEVMPGIIRDWKILPIPDGTGPPDNDAAAAIKVDATWKSYPLPETQAADHWWKEQERRRGFAVSVEKTLGKAKSYLAFSTFEAEKSHKVYLNPGAGLETIWLNGVRIYQAGAVYTGWHAGRERIPVDVKAGTNTILITMGGQFFLSVTEDNDW